MAERAPAAVDPAADLVERLRWLLRIRWLAVPIFVTIDLARNLLLAREAPWVPIAVGAAVLAANGVYSVLLRRALSVPALLRWARIESAVVVSLPVIMIGFHHDPLDPIRFGVLLGVVGAAVLLPRAGEVAVVGMWACASLVIADAFALDFEAARMTNALVARWAMEWGVIAMVTMVTGYLLRLRRRADERLGDALLLAERGRIEWEATFDKLDEIVILTDPEGLVTRANQAFGRAVGTKPPELAGRSLQSILAGHPEAWWSWQGDGVYEIEDPVFDTLFEVTVTRLEDRLVRVARDVGEQRRLYARLVQADKLAQVGVLASGLAHEINNPTAFVTSNLTELKGYLGSYESAFAELTAIALEAGRAERASALLQRGDVIFARREAQNAIGESMAGMERIRQLAANLRSLTRVDKMTDPAQPVALGEVIEAVVRTAAQELRAASARVEVQEPLWVMGRRGELVDVVLNLIVNAVQARDDRRPNHIALELRRDGVSAVLRVSDTGKGIPPAHVKRLFEPFFTTKAPGHGTGLGLSLARNIVLAHGGSIDVATELGTGSTFTVRLPAIEIDPGDADVRMGSRPST